MVSFVTVGSPARAIDVGIKPRPTRGTDILRNPFVTTAAIFPAILKPRRAIGLPRNCMDNTKYPSSR